MLAVARRAARPHRVPLGVTALLALALACQDVTVTPVAVRNVAVTPTDTTLTVGDELKLTAVVTDEVGNRLMDRAVTWSSEDDGIVSVDATGAAVAVSSGEVSVSAMVDGRSGTATIQVTEPPDEEVASVEVDPETTSIAVGRTVQLEAIAKSASGTVLEGRDVSWSSSNGDVATVDAEGVATGESAGEATITATIEGVEATASVTVTEDAEAVATVEVAPADTSITVGETAALNAIARSEDDTVLGGRDVSWSSNDEAVATVDAEGVVTGEGAGQTTITATIEGVSDTADVTVSLASVESVVVVPAEPNVLIGGAVQLEAIALAANGDTLADRTASWESEDPTVATVDGEGLVTGVAAGEATVIATIEGIPGTAEVTVSLVPVHSVVVEPTDTSLFVGGTVQLNAIALAENGDTLTGRTASWESEDPTVATVDDEGLVTGVAAGVATVIAMIEGVPGTAEMTISLVPVHSVVVEPDTSILVGGTVQLNAIALAENGDTLAGRTASWESEDPTVATVDDAGLVTGVAAGEATIIATIEGVPGSAQVTVSLVPVHGVAIEPTETTLAEGGTATLHAIVTDEDGNDLTDREVTWQSSSTSIATVSETGTSQLDATVTAGSCPAGQVSCDAEITATAESVTGTATITVEKVAATVTITPGGPIQLYPDSVIPLTAVVLAPDGTDLTSVKPVTWSSSDEAVAIVDPTTGQVTAVGTPCEPLQPFCSVTITATVDDASAQVEIQVLKPVASVTIIPGDTILRPLLGETAATFNATLAAADGTPLPGRTTSWSWAGGSTSASPCRPDSGQVRISLDPVEGVSDANGAVPTTATVESGAGEVRIWAEAEGATGCARLQVRIL